MRRLYKICHPADGGSVTPEIQKHALETALSFDTNAVLLSDKESDGVSDYLFTSELAANISAKERNHYYLEIVL